MFHYFHPFVYLFSSSDIYPVQIWHYIYIYIYTLIGNTNLTNFLDVATALISIQTTKAGEEGNCWVYLLGDITERLIGLPKGKWFFGIVLFPKAKYLSVPCMCVL